MHENPEDSPLHGLDTERRNYLTTVLTELLQHMTATKLLLDDIGRITEANDEIKIDTGEPIFTATAHCGCAAYGMSVLLYEVRNSNSPTD